MGQKFRDEAGNIWEMDAGGQPRLVSGGQSPAMGPAIGNDPKIPGQLQLQNLQAQRAQQEIAKNPLDIANAQTNVAQGQNSIRQSQIGNVQELRKEFNALPEVKLYGEGLSAVSGMMRAPKGPQGDLAVIYGFAKAMDPGSVVREGEMDMANSTASLAAQLKVKYKSFLEGKGLPPEVRVGLIDAARAKIQGMSDGYAQRYRQYRDQAQAMGLPPQQIVGNYIADAYRPIEEKYIRDHGGTPRSAADGAPVGSGRTNFHSNQGGPPRPPRPGERAVYSPDTDSWSYLTGQDNPNALEVNVTGGRMPEVDKRVNETSAFGSGLMGAADTMTFGLADEAAAGINAFGGALTGQGSFSDLYGKNLGIEREYQDRLRQRDPGATLAGGVVGGVVGMGGLNSALRANRFLAPLATRAGGVGSDMLYGAGYGAGSSNENRLAGAALGAGAAAGGNVLGRAVIAPAVRGAINLTGRGAPALPAGEGMIASQALKANPQDVLANLQQASDLKLPYALADADPRLRSLAGSAVRKSPDAFALAAETVGPRAQGQAERALGLINENLAPAGDIAQITADATKRAQAGSKDLYTKAMQHPAPDDAGLDEILRTPAGEQAARDAYSRALNAGEKPGDLSFEVDSITGQPRIVGKPNWRTLQYMKFEMDRAAQADPTLDPLRKRFTGKLGSLNPDFKAANAQYENIAKQGTAAQTGYGMTAPRITPSQAQSALSGATPDQLPYLQQGYASSLADTVERGNLSRDPYEMIYGSPAQRQKLGAVFPEGAGRFGQARGLEQDMSLTSRELLGGSPTQPRAEADKMFEGGGLGDALQFGLELGTGTPPISAFRSKLFGARGLLGGIQDAYRMGVGKSAKHKADQIAPILLNQNPDETAALLADMIKRQAMRDAYVQKTGMFGSAIGAPTAISLTGR